MSTAIPETTPCGRAADGSQGYCPCFRPDQIHGCADCGRPGAPYQRARYLCDACYHRWWRARARRERAQQSA